MSMYTSIYDSKYGYRQKTKIIVLSFKTGSEYDTASEKDILLLVTISEQQAAVSRVRTGVGVGLGAARQ